METFITNSEEETIKLGRDFAKSLTPGSVIALIGELGCGKTAFVKGVTDFFGTSEDVMSPTYTLVNEYNGSVPIYHFDVYRLENPDAELCDWMDDYLFSDGICLIEWANNISSVLPKNTIFVEFEKLKADGDNIRKITFL